MRSRLLLALVLSGLLVTTVVSSVAEARARPVARGVADLWQHKTHEYASVESSSGCMQEISSGKQRGYSDGFRVGSRQSDGVYRSAGTNCFESGYRAGFSQGVQDGNRAFQARNNPFAGCGVMWESGSRSVTASSRLAC